MIEIIVLLVFLFTYVFFENVIQNAVDEHTRKKAVLELMKDLEEEFLSKQDQGPMLLPPNSV